MTIIEHGLIGLLIFTSWVGSTGTFSKEIRNEMYRQAYFDNREALAYREDEDTGSSVTSVLRRRKNPNPVSGSGSLNPTNDVQVNASMLSALPAPSEERP